MADKSKMKCNHPVPSDRPGKKKMVKACSGGEEKLLPFGAKCYGNNYRAATRKVSSKTPKTKSEIRPSKLAAKKAEKTRVGMGRRVTNI